MLPDGVETPAYVYDLAEVRSSYALLRAALPAPSAIHYSVKANPHPDVLRTLVEQGAQAEVCSPGELDAALAAGWGPERLLYSGPGRRPQDLAHALSAGVDHFSVDSPYALEQLDALAAPAGRTVDCLVRCNDDHAAPGQGLVMTGVASPVGADVGWIEAEPERFASRPHAEVVGLHLYMGSNIMGEDALIAQFRQAAQTAARLGKVFADPFAVLNLGGGFGAPFAVAGALPRFPTLAARLARTLDELLPGWERGAPRITFESGRYLTATCGTLYARVLDVKRSHGKRIVVLESGVNHLGGMSGLRRLPAVDARLSTGRDVIAPAPAEAAAITAEAAMVTGPLCTPLDLLARAAELPEVAPGDVLAVGNVGAYGLQASLVAFLGHPLPVEVACDGDSVRSVTRQALQRRQVSYV